MWNACKQDMFPANAISLRWTQYLSRKKSLNKLKLPIEKEGTDIPKGYLQPLNRHMCWNKCLLSSRLRQNNAAAQGFSYGAILHLFEKWFLLFSWKMPHIASFRVPQMPPLWDEQRSQKETDHKRDIYLLKRNAFLLARDAAAFEYTKLLTEIALVK